MQQVFMCSSLSPQYYLAASVKRTPEPQPRCSTTKLQRRQERSTSVLFGDILGNILGRGHLRVCAALLDRLARGVPRGGEPELSALGDEVRVLLVRVAYEHEQEGSKRVGNDRPRI